MKKKLLFPILLFFLAQISFAQSSIITIFHQDGEKFWVIIDGVKQNEKPSASITLPNITTDFLRVKILFENPAIASIDQNLQTRDVDNNYTHCKYIIKPAKKGKHVMRINSYEPLTGNVQSNSNVVVDDKSTVQSSGSNAVTNTQQSNPSNPSNVSNVNQNTQVQSNTQSGGVNMNTNMSQSGNANQQGVQTGVSIQGVDPVTGEKIDVGMNINMNVGENGVQTGVNVKDGGNNGQNASVNTNMSISQSSTSTTTTTTNLNGGHSSNLSKPNTNQNNANPTIIEKNNNQTRPANADGCYSAMAPDAFASAKNSIKSKSFEDTKLTTAKQVAGSNCLSSSQVKEIMALFSFEDSKLTFAKFAYNRVVDKNNYFMVNDAFTFSSSVDELNEYIQGN